MSNCSPISQCGEKLVTEWSSHKHTERMTSSICQGWPLSGFSCIKMPLTSAGASFVPHYITKPGEKISSCDSLACNWKQVPRAICWAYLSQHTETNHRCFLPTGGKHYLHLITAALNGKKINALNHPDIACSAGCITSLLQFLCAQLTCTCMRMLVLPAQDKPWLV